MKSNKQDIPELKEGDSFVAILPSRKFLIERFKNEKEDKRIMAFVEELLHPKDPEDYCMYVKETERGLNGQVYIKQTLLEGNTVVLCKIRNTNCSIEIAPVVDRILYSEVEKSINRVTNYIGYNTPAIYLKFLTDIIPLKRDMVI